MVCFLTDSTFFSLSHSLSFSLTFLPLIIGRPFFIPLISHFISSSIMIPLPLPSLVFPSFLAHLFIKIYPSLFLLFFSSSFLSLFFLSLSFSYPFPLTIPFLSPQLISATFSFNLFACQMNDNLRQKIFLHGSQ